MDLTNFCPKIRLMIFFFFLFFLGGALIIGSDQVLPKNQADELFFEGGGG